MKRIFIIVSLILISAERSDARKLVRRYESYRHIASASSTNQFEKSVYVVGWVNSGANVLKWTKDLSVNELLVACGGKALRKGESFNEWVYTVSIYRPTKSQPNPRQPIESLEISTHNKSVKSTKVEPEDAILISRQKKE